MAGYLGIADVAVDLATAAVNGRSDSTVYQLTGEMLNAHTSAIDSVEAMFRQSENLHFANTDAHAAATLSRKTTAGQAIIDTVRLAMEVTGGRAYMRTSPIERLYRDVLANQFHPLPRARQTQFTGRVALGLAPVRLHPADAIVGSTVEHIAVRTTDMWAQCAGRPLGPAASSVRLMLTPPPGLPDAAIESALQRGWGFRADTIEYAPLGFGSHHWLVAAAGRRWFVTVDDLATKARDPDEPLKGPQGRLRVALQAARRLRDHGLEFVVAPLAAVGGAITVAAARGFEMAVYEHVAGIHHTWGPYPSRRERMAALELVVRLHRAPEGLQADAGREDFEVPRRHQLVAAIGDIGSTWLEGPFAERARDLLAPHADAVSTALTRFDQLTDGVRSGSDRWVITHGEPHQANTIGTAEGVVLIDWETLLVAPPERDLWMMALEDREVLVRYETRTRRAADPDALVAYRLWWDLAEIAAYIDQFRRPHETTDDTRVAWKGLQESLNPDRWQGL